MIKGVNKRIVEITSTQNDYFEKAVLYIRADKNTTTDTRIELEARAFLSSLMPPENDNKYKGKISLAVRLICISALILIITAIILVITLL